MIETTCPCGRRIRVRRSLKGRYISCPICGQFVRIGEPPGQSSDTVDPAAERYPAGFPGPIAPLPTVDPPPWPSA